MENTTLNQVTLILKMVKEAIEQEQNSFAQKNERSLSEALVKKDFDKVLPIIEYLEEKKSITPKEAEGVCGKSSATIRRYLGLLTSTGIVIAEGNTNNSIYRISDKIVEV